MKQKQIKIRLKSQKAIIYKPTTRLSTCHRPVAHRGGAHGATAHGMHPGGIHGASFRKEL